MSSNTAFPNRLDERAPYRPYLPVPWAVLLALWLLALTPRVLMAWKIDVLCPDATFYIRLAESLERGDLRGGFRELHLNTFPLVLVLLHQVGLSWETGGEWWGVVVSSLAVLPLFGWIRRQFDEPTAVVACCLYAVHPELIEWSPELIRDPTFWLLAATSLYLLWRGVVEVRVGLMVASGLAVTLASLTRVEGLFLLIPLFAWCLRRLIFLRTARRKLVVGVLCSLLVGPTLLLAVNRTLLRDHPHWESIRTIPLQLAARWSRSMYAPDETTAAAVRSEQDLVRPAEAAGKSWRVRSGMLLAALSAGMQPVGVLLLALGVVSWRRTWWRADHLPLLVVSLATVAGIWMHLWFAGESSSRYALLIVLVALPWGALGLMRLAAEGVQLENRLYVAYRGSTARWTALLLAAATLVGWTDALTTRYDGRRASAELGRRIREAYGGGVTIVGSRELQRLVGYYSGARFYALPADCSREELLREVRRRRADLVVLWKDDAPHPGLVERLTPDLAPCEQIDNPYQRGAGAVVLSARAGPVRR